MQLSETLKQAHSGLFLQLKDLMDGQPLGLAVSGGSDSMALMALIAALPSDQRIEVVTVDHRLRPEAAEEAEFVKATARVFGMPHETLIWADHPQSGNLMEQGSAARYALMTDWAQRRGISRIALAHTADDQAESFLMGLSRGAGLDGLCGMKPCWEQEGIRYLRPLLRARREELRAFLRDIGQNWRDDPSNESPNYTRARLRKLMTGLSQEGITVEKINRSIGNLVESQSLVKSAVLSAFHEIGHEAHGALFFCPKGFAAQPFEIRRRLMVAAIRWFSGRRYPARSEAIAHLLDQITAGKDSTLGGVQIRILPKYLRLAREAKAVAGPSFGPIWDNRWSVTLQKNQHIRALAEDLHLVPDWRKKGVPRQLALVMPSIWQGDRLVSAPFLDFGTENCALSSITFEGFLLSH